MKVKFIFALLIGIVCFFIGIATGIWIENEKRLKQPTIEVPLDELQAYVIPKSTRLMRGQTYSAQIGLMIVDTVRRSDVYINDRLIQDGLYKVHTTETGIFSYKGKILIHQNDGSIREYPFESKYSVEEPNFVVSADFMNILYAGIDNPIRIMAPIPDYQFKAITVQGGIIKRVNDGWHIRPSEKNGYIIHLC